MDMGVGATVGVGMDMGVGAIVGVGMDMGVGATVGVDAMVTVGSGMAVGTTSVDEQAATNSKGINTNRFHAAY